ncbi:hypothetical protein B7463_g5315, partial [Scytalidium lignicola]
MFVGDSTTRQVFWAVAKKLDQKRAEEEFLVMLDLELDGWQRNLQFVSDNVTLRFIWDPWLNSTGLDHELEKFRPDLPTSDSTGEEAEKSAGLILLGAPGIWNARHGGKNYMKDFKDAIDHVIPYMDHPHAPEKGLLSTPGRFTSRLSSPNLLLLAPVQVPIYDALSPSREATITPEKIDLMNDYLQQTSAHSEADVVWSYSLMTWAGRAAYEESGLHIIDEVARQKADVLLNLRCNVAAVARGSSFDRTCCTNYQPVVGTQSLLILAGLIAFPGLVFLRRKYGVPVDRLLPASKNMSALVTIGLVLCYCFYADRSQVFEKAQTYFQEKEFWSGCIIIAIVGMASIRKILTSIPNNAKPLSDFQDQAFLSRNQTDEWKGWMQLLILVYNYTGGETKLWIYEIVRLFVASYLFMTGFAHTLYFLRKEDYSFGRVATVLIRRNFLCLLLAYMMRNDYTFYYFALATSIWFLIIYMTLRIGINIPAFRAQFSLDMYIAFIGMMLGIFSHRVTHLKSGSINPVALLDRLLYFITIRNSRLFNATLTILALILLPGYWAVTRRSPDKDDYNWWQPYITFIPILSFVVLRNSNRLFRSYYSKTFAWFGRISLEMYVLQNHIWLAGDGRGLLRLGIWGPWVETAVLTPIFLWICWRIAGATQLLTGWIVYGDGQAPSGAQTEAKSPSLQGWIGEEFGSSSSSWRPSRDRGRKGLLSGILTKVGSSLGRRLMLMVVVLWVLNVTYGL